MIAGAAPPDRPLEQIGLRFLVMFAFMQTMHYVVWVGFLPRFAPDADRGLRRARALAAGRRAWPVGLVGGAFLAVLFLSDYFQGRALYGALATYHAYLEFPVLLALLMAPASSMTATPLIPASREMISAGFSARPVLRVAAVGPGRRSRPPRRGRRCPSRRRSCNSGLASRLLESSQTRKNCEPFVFGPALAIATTPRLYFSVPSVSLAN